MNSHLNNTFPFIVFPDRSEGDIIEERNYANSNSFVINFNKIAECHDTSQDNIESIEQTVTCQESNLNLSSTFQSNNKKKKNIRGFFILHRTSIWGTFPNDNRRRISCKW